MIKILIEKFPDVNARSQLGETPLHLACKLQSLDIVKLLTSLEEIFVDIEDNKGNTPLHFAVASQQVQIISHLTKQCRANPSIVNNLK